MNNISGLNVLFLAAVISGSLYGYAVFGDEPAATDKQPVPVFEWVTVKNPKGQPNGNGFHAFGYNCSISPPAYLTRLTDPDAAGFIFVRYEPKQQGYGAQCGAGTILEKNYSEFQQLSIINAKLKAEEKAEMARINNALDAGEKR